MSKRYYLTDGDEVFVDGVFFEILVNKDGSQGFAYSKMCVDSNIYCNGKSVLTDDDGLLFIELENEEDEIEAKT